ncbi:MAG TPA: hypothetical protein VFV45_02355, partial [Rubrobacteraceae bacterium]|nr:hypothetical protein [Rubrobacteraceae bacterium]
WKAPQPTKSTRRHRMANDAAACLSINLVLDTLEDMAITSYSSVNRKVTVPVGGSVATALLPT